MSQDLPYTVFDTDTEVAVASMLNAKLEFDEALLTENVVLHCGAQGGRGDVEGVVQDAEMQEHNQGNDSEDEDSSHYFKFSRTVVCDAASGSDAAGQLPSVQSISQLDGADSGSESDDSEAGNDEGQDAKTQNQTTPTKQLTIALKRLESIYAASDATVQQETTEPEFEENSQPQLPVLLESGLIHDEMSIQEEEVQMSSETPMSPTSQDEVVLDSTTGHFVSSRDGTILSASPPSSSSAGTVVYQNNNNAGDDKDDTASSADSVEGFKDDLNDPDYSPEPQNKKSPPVQMKTIMVKPKRPLTHLKRLSPKPYLQQQHKLKLLLPSPSTQTGQTASVSPAAATVCTVPRTVTSPIVINGLNSLPIQPGAKQGRTIAIRLDNSRPGSQQQVVTAPTGLPSSPAPSPQVLLVNRQGQILIKDPRSNTYQALNTNSPTYNKISQIAKILHSGNPLQRSVPRVIVKSRSNSSCPPDSNHTAATTTGAPTATAAAAAERKFVVRVVPVKSSSTPTSAAPVRSSPEPALSNIGESTAQAIINRAMATHRNTQRTKPIILSNIRQPKARHRRASHVQDAEDSDQSPVARSGSPSSVISEADSNSQPTPASSRHQVRVKRVSSVSERPSRKKSKMDFLMDPSSEVDDVNQARY